MTDGLQFTLSFQGNDSDNHQIDLYDAAQALVGFQRTLALTTSLMLNGELITQAPALKNAIIMSTPPKQGSWEIVATIMVGGYYLLTAPKDSILGNLVYSAYDFIIKECLGFHPKLDESLVVQYEEFHKKNHQIKKIADLNQARLQSLTEKCQNSIRDMHRPIYGKNTAISAQIKYLTYNNQPKLVGTELNIETYASLIGLKKLNDSETFEGRVSSYDVNTQKGRIFLKELGRTIPFELERNALTVNQRELLIESLKSYQKVGSNANNFGFVKLVGYRFTNMQDDVKKLYIIGMK